MNINSLSVAYIYR